MTADIPSEADTVVLHIDPDPEREPGQPAATGEAEQSGSDRIAAVRAYRDKARAAYKLQYDLVRRRIADWYATADVDDVQLGEEVVARRRRAAQAADEQLIREAAQVRARLASAKARAAQAGGDREARTPEVERLTGQLAAIETRIETREAEGPALAVTPAGPRDLSRARWGKKATRVAITIGVGMALLKGMAASPLVLLGALGAAPFGWWYLARPESKDERQRPDGARVSLVKQQPDPGPAAEGEQAQQPDPVYDAPTVPDFEAPPPPALDEELLTTALRDARIIKPGATVKVLAAPPFGPDGTATIVADLPAGVTVSAVRARLEAFAGALGRDVSMVDVDKAGAAGRMSLWLADSEPFEPPRPSPLLKTTGSLDTWRDGVPVAWAKRGNAVRLPVTNANFLIAGMTRSGKGVGAANLAVGAALDPWVNLRIVAGKNNGEWDPYAKSGVAATYFKPSPQRLLALLQALLADKDRREADLGKLGKSKLVPDVVPRLGGRELVIIDELATYTRPGKPLREEILEALIELSAVAAGAGELLVLITQYPEADVIPSGLAMNCGARWAMRVDNATQSNAILGGGQASNGRDASKFDPPIPGLGWLVNPFAGVTDLARSFDLDEDERGEVTQLLTRAAELRSAAGRLTGQWDDPIENHLVQATGLSSAAGGPGHDGQPGRALANLTPEQKAAYEAVASALDVMERFGRDAQLDEMADHIGDGMTAETLGQLLRAAGAGPTTKVTILGRRVQGYRRDTLRDLLNGPGGA